DRALASAVMIVDAECFALLLGARRETTDAADTFRYDRILSHRNLGVENAVLGHARFRSFYRSVVAPLEAGDRVVRAPSSLGVERGGRTLARVELPEGAPALLDFTGSRARRRLPIAEGRQERT